jgi:hypothetical protein
MTPTVQPARPERTRFDLKRELTHLYTARDGACRVVEVPPLRFLMADGAGDPNKVAAYREAVEALYAVSYAAKFLVRAESGVDSAVMPLEGLWWLEGEPPADLDDLRLADRSAWRWTMMIAQPEHITDTHLEAAREQVRGKKGLPGLNRLRVERYAERTAVQVLHLGPYSEEGPTIARLHAFIEAHQYRPRGRHHEVYLSDPRRTAALNMRTIIRQPVT